jgi:hypothetical protein
VVLITFLAVFSVVGVYSLYNSIVGKKLVKDLRVWESYKYHQKKALKWFCISLLGALVLGIGTQLLGNAFQNFISRKG